MEEHHERKNLSPWVMAWSKAGCPPPWTTDLPQDCPTTSTSVWSKPLLEFWVSLLNLRNLYPNLCGCQGESNLVKCTGSLTLAKNLISWSWGDFSLFPLLTMASTKTKVTQSWPEQRKQNSHNIWETEQLLIMKRPFDFYKIPNILQSTWQLWELVILCVDSLEYHHPFHHLSDESLSHNLRATKQKDGALRIGWVILKMTNDSIKSRRKTKDKAGFLKSGVCVWEYLSHCVLPQTICLKESWTTMAWKHPSLKNEYRILAAIRKSTHFCDISQWYLPKWAINSWAESTYFRTFFKNL